MSLFKPVCKSAKDTECIKKWRDMLEIEAKFKRIPVAFIPMYMNEKVNHWLLEDEGQLSFSEFFLLSQIFVPTNWESVAIHPSKVACILCAYVDTHSFESALLRVNSPGFLDDFFRAHIEDRSLSHSQDRILTSLIRERTCVVRALNTFGEKQYDGRSLEHLFSMFLQSRPGLCVPHAVLEISI